MGGRRREIHVDRAAFARQGAADTRSMLFGAGMRAESDGEHVAVKSLKAGWYDDEMVYIPTSRIVDAAGGALKVLEIGRALAAQGMIAKRHDAHNFYASYVPKVGKVKVYALPREHFGRSASDSSRFEVHQGGRA